MRKLLLLAAFAMAGFSLCFAEAFDELAFEASLDREALSAVDGLWFNITVPWNKSGPATVTTCENGKYNSYTVPVTTKAAANNPSNRPMNQGKEYSVTPLPSGSYSLGKTRAMSDSKYGVGIHIETTVTTSYKNSNETFGASDFFIHQTSQNNTWGCVGVKGKSGNNADMAKVLNSYLTSTPPRTLTVAKPQTAPVVASRGPFGRPGSRSY